MARARRPKSSDASAPVWLTPDQLDAWYVIHEMLLRLPAVMDAQLQRDSQLSYLEYYVLAGLSDGPGRTMRISELAVLTNAELSRISHLVTRMEKRGYLRRRPDPTDGRYTTAILTDEGYERLVEAAPGHVATVRELVFEAIGDQALPTVKGSAARILGSISDAEARRREQAAGGIGAVETRRRPAPR